MTKITSNMYVPHPPLFTFPELPWSFSDRGRVYNIPNGEQYQSVTSFLAAHYKGDTKTLDAWKARVGEEEANRRMVRGQKRGTYLHLLTETYLKGKDLTQEALPIYADLFLQVKRQLNNHLSDLLAVEATLYSNKYKLAGRADIIGIWDEKVSVIDLKTVSTRQYPDTLKKHFYQAAAYAHLFHAMANVKESELAVEQLVILVASEEEPWGEVFTEPAKLHMEAFDILWQNHLIHI